ncbi:MAG: hypothetical protein ACI957_004977 [Verrucomicrobiales bacterium]
MEKPAIAGVTRRTLISSLLTAIAAFTLVSCGKGLIPPEIAGLGDLLKGATSSLQGVADAGPETAAKAKEALPDLENVGTELSSIQSFTDKLPAPAKAVITKALESFGGPLEAIITKVSGLPGVGGPALDKITAGLTALKG